jgi:protein-S-isoprenylcysteine O-methyltransferase Ste14
MGIDPTEQNALVLAGPYAYVRHPIYALSQIMMIATVIAIPTPLFITAGLIHLLLLQWEARREEQHLTHIHGDHYVAYCTAVGRFIPKLTRHTP